MKKGKLKPARRRIQSSFKPGDLNRSCKQELNVYHLYPALKQTDELGILWETDFTYLRIHGKYYYKASVIEVATREVLGIAISDHHDSDLVCQAFFKALRQYPAPVFIHSDQGSEYTSAVFARICERYGITISMSDKSSPWQNAHQESFFSHFKLEFGDFSRFESLGELVASIYDQVYYYNYQRIHTAVKMLPAAYRDRLLTISSNRQVV